MHKKTQLEMELLKKIKELNKNIEENNILELSEVLGNTKKLFVKNFFSGIIKGIGIGIGFSILSAILIYILQKIIRLNIPVISEYIADIIDIVQKNR